MRVMSDTMKDSFYVKLEHVFDEFTKYHMSSLLRDSNASIGREDIFKLIIGNESSQKTSDVNGVRVVNFAA
jgi:hypothetical protein